MEERAIDRLRQFVAYLKSNGIIRGETAFERHCGLSNKYIANSAMNGKGTIGSDMIARISNKFPELDIRWLCSGEGEMLVIEKNANVNYRKAYDGAMMQIEALRNIIREQEKDN